MRRWLAWPVHCGLLLVVCLCSIGAFAQGGTASISGRVTDPDGLGIAGAKIEAVNEGTNSTTQAQSDPNGLYTLPTLPPGNYRITAEKEGFQKAIKSGLDLHVADSLSINFSLRVGSVAESVTVSGEAPQVETTTHELGSLIDDKKVVDLPLNGRNYIDLTLLQPGVTQHRALAASPSAGGVWFVSNGASVHSNYYTLDGASLGTFQGVNSASVAGDTLGLDGIREYRILTNSYGAEYGMTMGSQMVMVSKNGTNIWHGDVFEYLRNSALDARNYFDTTDPALTGGHRLPQFQRNNFGGSIGGPIQRDKTFFYFTYEGLRQRQGQTTVDTVMAAGCHGGPGAVITNKACPQLGTIPSVTIAPAVAPLLTLFPVPNLPGNRFTYPFTAPTRDDYAQIRVDHTFSANDTAFVRHTLDDAHTASALIPNSYPGFTVTTHSRNQFLTISENHVFGPTLINTARFSFSRTTPFIDSHSPYTGPQFAFVPAAPDTLNQAQEVGAISIGGISPFGPFATAPSYLPQNVFSWADDMFYTRGAHSLKFGLLINRFQKSDLNPRNYRGSVTFANVAAFLRGTTQSFVELVPGSIPTRTYRMTSFGFYAQDDYRVVPRLTLNLGLRYEFTNQFHEKNGLQDALRNPLTDAAPTVGPPFKNPSLRNFGPRVGFAWDVFGDGKTSVRSGFALLYDIDPYGTAIGVMQPNERPFATQNTATGGTLSVPFDFSKVPPADDISLMDYNLKQQRLLSYNLSVQHQFPFGIALSVAYAGSRGLHQLSRRDVNPTIPQGVPDAAGNCVKRPAGQPVNLTSMVSGEATACWLGPGIDPYTNPNFGSILLQTSAASSKYNALQTVVSKRLSNNLEFQSAYTFSKLMDVTQVDAANELSNGASTLVDQFHDRLDYAVSNFDSTHNWRLSATYHLPNLPSKSGFLPKILNGWQTSGIYTLQSGYPFTVNLQSNRSLSQSADSAAGLDRPNLAPGRTLESVTHGVSTPNGIDPCPTAGQKLGTPDLWFDPCAFTIPKAGFLGNLGRNTFRGPGQNNLDFSLVKNTAIPQLGEAGSLQFRAEFFNLLNHPNFAIPTGRNVYAARADVEAPLSNAGVITTTSPSTSRQVQLALKIVF